MTWHDSGLRSFGKSLFARNWLFSCTRGKHSHTGPFFDMRGRAEDMLMVESSDELFSIPVFAMSHDPLPLWSAEGDSKMQSKQTRLNNAARVVHPNKRFFRSLVKKIQSGDYKDHPLLLGMENL